MKRAAAFSRATPPPDPARGPASGTTARASRSIAHRQRGYVGSSGADRIGVPGTCGIRALGGMVAERPASKSSNAWPISAFGVHHEGPVVLDRLFDRRAPPTRATRDQPCQRVLSPRRPGGPSKSPTGERHQTALPWIGRAPSLPARPDPGEHVDEGVEVRLPGELQERAPGGDAGVQAGPSVCG